MCFQRIIPSHPSPSQPPGQCCWPGWGLWGLEIQVFAQMYVVAQYNLIARISICLADKAIVLCLYTRYEIYKMYQYLEFT